MFICEHLRSVTKSARRGGKSNVTPPLVVLHTMLFDLFVALVLCAACRRKAVLMLEIVLVKDEPNDLLQSRRFQEASRPGMLERVSAFIQRGWP